MPCLSARKDLFIKDPFAGFLLPQGLWMPKPWYERRIFSSKPDNPSARPSLWSVPRCIGLHSTAYPLWSQSLPNAALPLMGHNHFLTWVLLCKGSGCLLVNALTFCIFLLQIILSVSRKLFQRPLRQAHTWPIAPCPLPLIALISWMLVLRWKCIDRCQIQPSLLFRLCLTPNSQSATPQSCRVMLG